jgi:hypothetical protein
MNGSNEICVIYEVRPRKDRRGFDLISDALPFGRLWYCEPDDAVEYAKFFSRSHDAVIRVYDDAGTLIGSSTNPYLRTPVPARGTACGLAPPSSTIFRDACRRPLAPGVKVTSTVQLSPAPSIDPHVVVSAKSPKFAPLMPMPEICKFSLPIFVTVAV